MRLGNHAVQGFLQHPTDDSTFGGKAIEASDSLQASTVCTKVKNIKDKAEYKEIRKELFSFYTDAVDEGYNLFSNNCCTVAYNFVKHINGKVDAIEASNFNHGMGVHLNAGFSSFIVDTIDSYTKPLTKTATEEEKTATTEKETKEEHQDL